MVDSLTLYDTMFHKIRLVDIDGNTHEGEVIFYESEWDSGSNEAEIGFNGTWYKQSQIKSVEISD